MWSSQDRKDIVEECPRQYTLALKPKKSFHCRGPEESQQLEGNGLREVKGDEIIEVGRGQIVQDFVGRDEYLDFVLSGLGKMWEGFELIYD